MVDPKYITEPQAKACAACAFCAMCFADGPFPDFEGIGLYGIVGLF